MIVGRLTDCCLAVCSRADISAIPAMHTMLTNLCCLKQDTLLCAYSNISPHVAHCKMLIALLSSVIEFMDTNPTEMFT